MIVPLLIALAVLFAVIYNAWPDETWAWRIGSVFFGLFMGFAAFAVSAVLLGLTVGALPAFSGNINTTSAPLIVIKDGNTTSGSFFLGSGVISGDASFTYYQNDNGVITLNSVPSYRASIIYTNDTPTVDKNVPACSNLWIPGYDCMFGHTTYVFHIPEGSVQSSYQLPTK